MTAGSDSLAQIQAEARARSDEISENVRAKSREIAEASQRLREENEQFSKDLEKRVAEQEADKNQWSRSEEKDTTYKLGGAEDEEYEERPAPSPAPETLATPQSDTARRGRHARRPVDDDEDFSEHNWLG
jgi:hypothetical protein